MLRPWRGRLATVRSMAALSWARLLVVAVPFSWWRDRLGCKESVDDTVPLVEGQRLARQIEWAAERLPGEVKCLPQAMVLSWILRSNQIRHAVVFAVRPAGRRQQPDSLHAWVEIDGTTVLGNLPGPWLETLRLGN